MSSTNLTVRAADECGGAGKQRCHADDDRNAVQRAPVRNSIPPRATARTDHRADGGKKATRQRLRTRRRSTNEKYVVAQEPTTSSPALPKSRMSDARNGALKLRGSSIEDQRRPIAMLNNPRSQKT